MNYYPDIAYVLIPTTAKITIERLLEHAGRALAPPFTAAEQPHRRGELMIKGPRGGASLRVKKIDKHLRAWLASRGHALARLPDAPRSFRWTLIEIVSGPNHDLDYRPSYAAARGLALAWPGARAV